MVLATASAAARLAPRDVPDTRRRAIALLAGGLMEPDEVAGVVVEGLRDERFLILPHAEVANHMALKGAQPERWLKGMRKLVRQAREASGA